MDYDKLYHRGIINTGNLERFSKVMRKATSGESITIGFLGGSITQGSLSSKPTTCYAYKVYEWWVSRFKRASVTYRNAGIGATTSQFGVARLESDLLSYEPDVVFLEYSVNDEDDEKFQQTFEGCVRNILNSSKAPALFMFHNVQYDTGINAQRIHSEIGKHYDLPIVSMKESIYQAIVDQDILPGDITPDNLHPNDAGHELVSGVITNLLNIIYDKIMNTHVTLEYAIPNPYTRNSYANTKRYHNKNISPTLTGFVKDEQIQHGITDVFKNGWTARNILDTITFEFEGTKISVLYRKSIHQPAPVAKAIIDHNPELTVILDANFTETWGDKLELQDIMVDGIDGKHTLTITLIQVDENLASEFYLASVIY